MGPCTRFFKSKFSAAFRKNRHMRWFREKIHLGPTECETEGGKYRERPRAMGGAAITRGPTARKVHTWEAAMRNSRWKFPIQLEGFRGRRPNHHHTSTQKGRRTGKDTPPRRRCRSDPGRTRNERTWLRPEQSSRIAPERPTPTRNGVR